MPQKITTNMRASLNTTKKIICNDERLELSQRDSSKVLSLLQNPPKPNSRLLRAVREMYILKDNKTFSHHG
ncbi:type II toxin -antitoxin system TacA 1-like antitoxin [Cysteiniphilum sp. 6C5]|uniref:type II toxin -antitoxin system TacA 1-like antitoxin n=1 Tax=unclassified Cysteiniphilum TaxID=2610889 RepID=UPI003F840575